jgi:hypothetical protein
VSNESGSERKNILQKLFQIMNINNIDADKISPPSPLLKGEGGVLCFPHSEKKLIFIRCSLEWIGNEKNNVPTLERLCENDKSEKKCETKTLYFVWIPAFAGMTKTLGSVITQPLERGKNN